MVCRRHDLERLVARHREGDDNARTAALARRDGDVSAKLHCEAADQSETEAAATATARPSHRRRVSAIVLDHQFDLFASLVRLDADLRRGDGAEIVVERAAYGLGYDQA